MSRSTPPATIRQPVQEVRRRFGLTVAGRVCVLAVDGFLARSYRLCHRRTRLIAASPLIPHPARNAVTSKMVAPSRSIA